jgi:hypothetical protein
MSGARRSFRPRNGSRALFGGFGLARAPPRPPRPSSRTRQLAVLHPQGCCASLPRSELCEPSQKPTHAPSCGTLSTPPPLALNLVARVGAGGEKSADRLVSRRAASAVETTAHSPRGVSAVTAGPVPVRQHLRLAPWALRPGRERGTSLRGGGKFSRGHYSGGQGTFKEKNVRARRCRRGDGVWGWCGSQTRTSRGVVQEPDTDMAAASGEWLLL